MQQRVLNQGAEPGVSYLKAGDESGLSGLNKKGSDYCEISKMAECKWTIFRKRESICKNHNKTMGLALVVMGSIEKD